jgi:hypothetical protein
MEFEKLEDLTVTIMAISLMVVIIALVAIVLYIPVSAFFK